jgi:predicted transcriptional regulator
MSAVAEAIKKIRWELRISQQHLAKELGCTQTAISAYELGQREPIYRILKKLDEFAKKNKVKVNLL